MMQQVESSTKFAVLRHVRAFIERSGYSPSLSEIAAPLGLSKTHVTRVLEALCRDGLLLRQARVARGLALPEEQALAIATLRRFGWKVDEDILHAAPLAQVPEVTDWQLSAVAKLSDIA